MEKESRINAIISTFVAENKYPTETPAEYIDQTTISSDDAFLDPLFNRLGSALQKDAQVQGLQESAKVSHVAAFKAGQLYERAMNPKESSTQEPEFTILEKIHSFVHNLTEEGSPAVDTLDKITVDTKTLNDDPLVDALLDAYYTVIDLGEETALITLLVEAFKYGQIYERVLTNEEIDARHASLEAA